MQNAAATTNTPLGGGSWSHNVHVGSVEGGTKFTYADPHYFATMGIPLLTGRGFTDLDTNHAPFVLVVNQTFIRKYIGTAQPIGQLVHVMPEPSYPERTYQIIGTIPDTKYADVREDTPPIAFAPAAQLPVDAQGPGIGMMIAFNTGPDTITAIRRTLAAKYPSMTLQFVNFQEQISDKLVGDRLMAMLSGFFGFLAALLVVVGLYGVLSYFVTRRRNEIGIRIALGAKRRQVIALIMRDTAACCWLASSWERPLRSSLGVPLRRCSLELSPMTSQPWPSPSLCWRSSPFLAVGCRRAKRPTLIRSRPCAPIKPARGATLYPIKGFEM